MLLDVIWQARKEALKGDFAMPGLKEPQEPYHRFLFALARLLKPQRMLELGVKVGNGVYHMSAGWPGAQVVGVDTYPQDLPKAMYQNPNFRFELSDSVSYLIKNRMYTGHRFDLIHIDTEHVPAHVERELAHASGSLNTPGVICIDDVGLNDDMRDWWATIRRAWPQNTISLDDLHVTGYGVYFHDYPTGSYNQAEQHAITMASVSAGKFNQLI